MRCAQQQPIAVNPGIDGADLADLEAHAATPRRVRALSHDTAAPAPAHRSLTGRRSQLGGKKRGLNFSACFFSKYDPSARARHYTGLSMQLHHFHHRPPRTKGSGQRNLNYHISLPGLHHLAGVGINALAGHQARRRIGAVRSAEEQDVRLRPGGGRCGGRLRACGRVAHATGEGGMRRQALSARPGGAWHKGVVSRPVAGTCGWNSAPIRGFAARRCRATPYQSAGAPWAQSWQCAWARSRDCAASERVN